MTLQHSQANGDSAVTSHVEPGEFPFPLTGGRAESPYLTWLRNHSNYMAARGLFDYLRAASVLGRGIIINFLIFLPYLLLLAIVLAYTHHWMRAHPFVLTFGVLVCAVAWTLLFPVMVPLVRVFAYNKSVETGNESSVKQRDLYERSFGALLLAILAAAALELEPWILEYVHDQILLGRIGWPGGLAMASTGLALLGSSNKLLSALGEGVKKQLAMVLIGLLGLLVPLIVVLSATDFLLYGLPLTREVMFSPLAVPAGGVLAITIAIALGVRRKVFTTKEIYAVVGLLFVALVLGWAVIEMGNRAVDATEKSKKDLAETLLKVHELAKQFENISNRQELAPEVATLVDQFVEASREAGNSQDQDFEQQLPLVSLGDELSAQPERSLVGLKKEITRLAYGRLLESMVREPPVDEALRSKFVLFACDPLDQNEPIPAADPERSVRERFKQAVGKCDPGVLKDYEVVLQQFFQDTDLLFLVSEEKLYQAVQAKFIGAPGKAEVARLVGKEELAKLLTKKELVALVFPSEASDRKEFLTRAVRTRLLEGALPAFPEKGAPNYDERTRLTALELARLESKRPAAAPDTLKHQKLAFFYSTHEASAPGDSAVDGDPTTEEIARAAGEVLAKQVLREFDVDHLRALAFGLGGLVQWGGSELHAVAAEGARNGTRVEIAEPARDHKSGDTNSYTLTDDAEGRFAIDASSGVVTVADGTRLNYASAASHIITVQTTDRQRGVVTRTVEIEVVADKDRLQKFLELAQRPLEDLVNSAFSSPLAPEGVRTKKDREEIWNLRPYRLPDEYRDRVLLAEKSLGNDTDALAKLARAELIDRALNPDTAADQRQNIVDGFATHNPALVDSDQLAHLWINRFWAEIKDRAITDDLVAKLMFGVLGRLERNELSKLESQVTEAVLLPKAIFLALLLVVIWLACWLTVDVNLTSIHGLYRDRLASAFLVGRDTKGDIDIEDDIDLEELCRYEARSTAPYHLINVALNLQGSTDIGIRDRKSDFFIFSKRFIGGDRTGYCRSVTMEQVFPQMDLATAMAISAAAASPNMGRATSPFLVAFLTLLNIRLGFWVPNPGVLEGNATQHVGKWRRNDRERATQPMGFTFREVFAEELREIERRWGQVYSDGSTRRASARGENSGPAVEYGLVGIGFSGGGIRSASINLGITQALHRRGVFDHVDYMSTVSGGGYLGSSISTLMRSREKLFSERAGKVAIEAKDEQIVIVQPSEAGETKRTYRFSRDATLNVRHGEHVGAGKPLLRPRAARGRSDIAGTVTVAHAGTGEPSVTVQGGQPDEHRVYRFSRFDSVVVKTGDTVKAGDRLIQRHDTLGRRFRWRVRPQAFLREMLGKLDETHHWVNLSDGGHIENLATIELLRRRCKYIIVGDGEADPNLHFAGLATLMRCAYIDLGITIDIDLEAIRLRKSANDDGATVSAEHWAIGKITYPRDESNQQPEEIGHLLYLKSSLTGDESETIREYRHRHPTFPHQSTADQFFNEDQFEAYRALGQHIAEQALQAVASGTAAQSMSFVEFEEWFKALWEAQNKRAAANGG